MLRDARARSSSTRSTPSSATSAARTWRSRSSGSTRSPADACQRIGLSATQQPIEAGRAVPGRRGGSTRRLADCAIVDTGHVARAISRSSCPGSPLETVDRERRALGRDLRPHRGARAASTARRSSSSTPGGSSSASRSISRERLGEERVAAHHGSLSREHRLRCRAAAQGGRASALVATASLELGIDVGDVDLVVPARRDRARSRPSLQRVGRSGHSAAAACRRAASSRSRATSSSSARRCSRGPRAASSTSLRIPEARSTSWRSRSWRRRGRGGMGEDELFALVRRRLALPRSLARRPSTTVLEHAGAKGSRRGAAAAARTCTATASNGRLRARRGARLAAITSGGAIPDAADYEVVLEPDGRARRHGQRGLRDREHAPATSSCSATRSWRIRRVEPGRVRVEDARGAPPTIPFWLGEAPARTRELSQAVSRLREEVAERLAPTDEPARGAWRGSTARCGISDAAARAGRRLPARRARRRSAPCPRSETLVAERFFDESRRHAARAPRAVRRPHQPRLGPRAAQALLPNVRLRAPGRRDRGRHRALARPEAQLSRSTTSSRFLRARRSRDVLDAGPARRADVRHALALERDARAGAAALPRRQEGPAAHPAHARRRPARRGLPGAGSPAGRTSSASARSPITRSSTDDRRLPRRGDGHRRASSALLERIERGDDRARGARLTEPSPLAHGILNAQARTPSSTTRRSRSGGRRPCAAPLARSRRSAADLGALDPEAIARVRAEAWPEVRDADELHDALVVLGFVTAAEGARVAAGQRLFDELVRSGPRVRGARTPARGLLGRGRAPRAARGGSSRVAGLAPPLDAAARTRPEPWRREEALREIVRGRLEGVGPTTVARAGASRSALAPATSTIALAALEARRLVMRGTFHPRRAGRRMVRAAPARAHPPRSRSTGCAREIEPGARSGTSCASSANGSGSLPDGAAKGRRAWTASLEQLEGFEAPASAWEREILPARVERTTRPCSMRCASPAQRAGSAARRESLRASAVPSGDAHRARSAGAVRRWLARRSGAMRDRADGRCRARAPRARAARARPSSTTSSAATGLLRAQAETALGELVSRGLVASDGFSGLRALLVPSSRRREPSPWRRRGRAAAFRARSAPAAGRSSSATRRGARPKRSGSRRAGAPARWGVVFRRVLDRESLLPPWRDLLACLPPPGGARRDPRRRFVAGFSGEQFALPEAVGALRRAVRKKERAAARSSR